MKAYKNNFFVQLILLIAVLIALGCSLFERSAFGTLLFLQIILGFSQVLGGLILFATCPKDKYLTIYLYGAGINVAACISLILLSSIISFTPIYVFFLLIFPWALAILYWFISFRNIRAAFFKKSIFQ